MNDSPSHKTVPMKAIPEPEPNTRTVFIGEVVPLIKGAGDIDLVCGKCGETLVAGIDKGQIKNIVIRCPKCKTFNDIVWKLSFAEVRQRIAEHLKTALNIEEFSITFAKQEHDLWKANVEFIEKTNSDEWSKSALFSIDAVTGEVIEFREGDTWRF